MGAPAGDWVLTFREECDGTSVSSAKWHTQYYRGGLFDYYSWSGSAADPANVSVGNGHCQLKLERRPRSGRSFATGVLDSGGKFEQLYGFFEVRLRAARGTGFRTAALLTHARTFPPQVDLARVSGSNTSRATFTIFYDDSGGQNQDESLPAFLGPDFAQDFHVFGIDWRPEEMSFYVDGVKVAAASRTAARGVKTALKFELTAHINGELAEPPDSSTPFPSYVTIDWVRAWRLR
jgi:beta-glucanase (GH16 family)